MTYDSRNNLLTFTDANGHVTHRHYDGSGKMVSQINALGKKTRYEYDGEDRLIRVIDALTHVTELGYDERSKKGPGSNYFVEMTTKIQNESISA